MFKEFFLWFENRPKFLWFLIFTYMSLIFYLSSIPYPPRPAEGIGIKKIQIVEHVIEFGILGVLLFLGFRALKFWNFREKAFIFALIFGIFYGIIDEFHQYFVPGRYAELSDIIANSLGVLLGILFVKLKLR